ncbi:hypothetical protein ACJ73_06164 [Blastomyces percursus]|uniref:Uncharacterized protein n=1 Tax=Blastomyces percursus TaxID=1658174 RepID=A0A1J9Q322_9EURO|nr:hypothetical protein ACJ73_06164 [Blastomyces percursus]
MITTRIGRLSALASKSRAILGARSMATVSDSPLDKKVEMCNHEKGNYINYKYGTSSLYLAASPCCLAGTMRKSSILLRLDWPK